MNPTKQEMFEYLDELRDSGITNMFGARPFLQKEFKIKPDIASATLSEWMSTFSERHPGGAR